LQIALPAAVAIPAMVTIKTPVRAALLSDNFDAGVPPGSVGQCASNRGRAISSVTWRWGVLGIASISTDPQAAGTTLQANFNPLCRL
jgi:hypothetical protein